MKVLERAWAWLTPVRRKATYGVLASAGMCLVIAGIVSERVITGTLGVAAAGLDVVALVLAAIHARKWQATGLYSAGVILVGSLAGAGWITGDAASTSTRVLAVVAGVVPLVVALVRTDPATPTGEPAAEYDARHAAP